MIYIFLTLYLIFKLMMMLRIYQQSHYKLKEYLKYMLRNFIYINGFLLATLIIILILDSKDAYLIGSIIFMLYGLFLYLRRKVRINFTSRIKRTIVLNLLLFLILLIKNKFIIGIFLISFEYLSIIIFFISKLIEDKINKKYINLSSNKLSEFRGKIIAITGSYGKTSTKYYLGEILGSSKATLFTKNSYNTMLGISKVINEEELNKYDYFITEMGASHVGDIEELMNYVKPNMTILTSIGYMHLDSFGSIENIITEKCKVADMLTEEQITIANFDNEFIRKYKFKNKVIGYGFNTGIYQAKDIFINDYLEFDVYKEGILFDHYLTKINGMFNVLNILAVISCLDVIGIEKSVIKEGVFRLENVKNRLNITKHSKGVILDDSFNSNIEGAKNALKEMQKYEGKKILITPGFVEMNDVLDKINDDFSTHIKENVDLVFLIGKYETKDLYNKLKNLDIEVYVFDSFKEAYRVFKKLSSQFRTVLLIENDLPDIYKRGF